MTKMLCFWNELGDCSIESIASSSAPRCTGNDQGTVATNPLCNGCCRQRMKRGRTRQPLRGKCGEVLGLAKSPTPKIMSHLYTEPTSFEASNPTRKSKPCWENLGKVSGMGWQPFRRQPHWTLVVPTLGSTWKVPLVLALTAQKPGTGNQHSSHSTIFNHDQFTACRLRLARCTRCGCSSWLPRSNISPTSGCGVNCRDRITYRAAGCPRSTLHPFKDPHQACRQDLPPGSAFD